MPRPFAVTFGPFDQGLMNAVDPSLVPPGGAVEAVDVDLSAGTLRGLYGPGSAFTYLPISPAADASTLLFISNDKWLGNAHDTYAMADYDMANGDVISYVTEDDGTPDYPQLYKQGDTTAYKLGIDPPAAGSLTVAQGSSLGGNLNKRWAVTFVTADGWESNPVFDSEAPTDAYDFAAEADLTIPTSSDSRVTHRNIYSTEDGDPDGPLYYLGEASGNVTTSYTDAGAVPTLTRPLNWRENGGPEVTNYPYDHSPAPILTMLSDTLHSVTEGSGTPGSGIVVGAEDGNILRWSAVGYPWYWPKRNRWAAPDAVRYATTDLAQTLVFTGAAVYALSGVDDAYMSNDKLATDVGVRERCGKTVARTPYGVVYLSQRGLMLLTGQAAVPLAADKLSPDFWNGLTQLSASNAAFAGAYYGTRYFLAHADGTVILDFTDYPNVRVTESELELSALHSTPFEGADHGPGLYVCQQNDRNGSNYPYIRPWMPDQSGARGSRRSWSWTTGETTAGEPMALKKPKALRIKKSGEATVTVFYDGVQVLSRSLADGEGEGKSWTRLPPGHCRTLQVEVSGAGTVEVYGFSVEGVKV